MIKQHFYSPEIPQRAVPASVLTVCPVLSPYLFNPHANPTELEVFFLFYGEEKKISRKSCALMAQTLSGG